MKKTIRKQITESFIILLVCTIGLCWMMNSLFLEFYYTSDKSKSLKMMYNYLNVLEEDEFSTETFSVKINKLCEDNNVDVLIMNSDLSVKYASTSDTSTMQNILFNYIFGDQNNDNIIHKMTDKRSGSEYFVMWGYLHNGDFYVMRTALQSIIDSVKISNQFLLYVGIMIALLGSLVATMISKQITKPLLELTSISERMTRLDFNAKYKGKGTDEINLLGERMNNLSETLETTISELKTANNELQRDIKKKEEIDEMRQDFISNVSHELKTPISLIQGYAEGLQECINDDEESRNFYCEVIMDEAAKMNQMVKKLLSLTQLEFGGDNITMERVNLTTLISNILNSTTILAGDREIEVQFDRTREIFVWADEFKLEEVVTNYVSNAFNHVSGANRIEVTMEEKPDEMDSTKTLVRVNVFNTGALIPEEDLDKLWIKFYKVDKARTREYGGSGIGLSIVKAILEAHHQKCGVENVHEGVNFWFEMEKCSLLESENML